MAKLLKANETLEGNWVDRMDESLPYMIENIQYQVYTDVAGTMIIQEKDSADGTTIDVLTLDCAAKKTTPTKVYIS